MNKYKFIFKFLILSWISDHLFHSLCAQILGILNKRAHADITCFWILGMLVSFAHQSFAAPISTSGWRVILIKIGQMSNSSWQISEATVLSAICMTPELNQNARAPVPENGFHIKIGTGTRSSKTLSGS